MPTRKHFVQLCVATVPAAWIFHQSLELRSVPQHGCQSVSAPRVCHLNGGLHDQHGRRIKVYEIAHAVIEQLSLSGLACPHESDALHLRVIARVLRLPLVWCHCAGILADMGGGFRGQETEFFRPLRHGQQGRRLKLPQCCCPLPQAGGVDWLCHRVSAGLLPLPASPVSACRPALVAD